MSYYTLKVYGVVCDVCEDSAEAVPRLDVPDKLAWARRQVAKKENFRYVNGRDICPKRDAVHLRALAADGQDGDGRNG